MKKILSILAIVMVVLLSGCKKNDTPTIENGGYTDNLFNQTGKYNRYVVQRTLGFPDERLTILDQIGMSMTDFKQYSVMPSGSLTTDQKTQIKAVRVRGISQPSVNTLLQKVIPLDDVVTYMNNVNGGMIDGIVYVAGDIKMLRTQVQIIDGLRLDYSDSKFKKDGAGYAVIRYPYNIVDELIIPFSRDMGGNSTGTEPFTGTGFTASLLGDGGYPQYTYTESVTPPHGAELFEVTPMGNEILRAQFISGRWQAFEGVLLRSE